MKSIYKYLTLIVLLPVWVIPMGQLSLYKHICNSSQTINYTRSINDDCCGGSCGLSELEVVDACCSTPVEIRKEACCEFEAVELASLLLHNQQEKELRFSVFQMSCPHLCEHCSIAIDQEDIVLPGNAEEIPPLISGRQWLIEHKQLKIAILA